MWALPCSITCCLYERFIWTKLLIFFGRLSRTVNVLEFCLFERGEASCIIGEGDVKFAKKIRVLENAMAAKLAAVDEHFDSTIEIGMSLNDGVELLPRLVKKFHDVHPETIVHLDAGYEPELIAKLKRDRLDFALLETSLLKMRYPARPLV